jgi:hypothetical protein
MIPCMDRAILVLVMFAGWPAWAGPQRTTVDRQQFARAMAGVKPKMTAEQVRKILGPADDVRDQSDPGGIATTGTERILCYGTRGHLTFPTLGQVYLDQRGRVQYLFGNRGSPPDPKLIAEPELRRLLRLVDRAPALGGYGYNPLRVIQIVNALQPLGKARALAVIREYLRVAAGWHHGAREGLFLVLRVLFEVPSNPGHMPPMFVGAPSPAAPKDPRRIPRFPIALRGDVPLMLVSGYALGGHPQPVEQHVEHFAKHGQLRRAPLRPTDDPTALLDDLRRSSEWPYAKGDQHGAAMIANQLLQLVSSMYARAPDAYGQLIGPGRGFPTEWSSVAARIRKAGTRWSAKQACYLRRDGSHLPPRTDLLHRRHLWQQPVGGGQLALVVERQDANHVRLELRWSTRRGRAVPDLQLEVFVPQPRRQVALFTFGRRKGAPRPGEGHLEARAGAERHAVQSKIVALKERWLQASLSVGKKTRTGPRFDLDAARGRRVIRFCY